MLRHVIEQYFNRRWYQQADRHWFWSPLSRLVERKARERRRQFLEDGGRPLIEARVTRVPPVLVVGNITVGGTGKTPLVIYLIEHLRAQGMKVAVISRGYGGKAPQYPYILDDDSTPAIAGDEPVMIYQRTGVTLVVDPMRRRALQWLAENGDFDLVISDDGLQHYELPRQYEIVVIDGSRGIGNGACLPAGPLREPADRLANVDAVVINGAPDQALRQRLHHLGVPAFEMHLEPQGFISLLGEPKSLMGFSAAEQDSMSAIAAIGNPQRFFNTLSAIGLHPKTRPYPDHHGFSEDDFVALGSGVLLMTEKDAVKVRHILPTKHRHQAYYLAVTAMLNDDLIGDIIARFKGEQRHVRL